MTKVPRKKTRRAILLTYQVNSNLTGEQIKEYVKENVEPVVRAWEEVVWVDVTREALPNIWKSLTTRS